MTVHVLGQIDGLFGGVRAKVPREMQVLSRKIVVDEEGFHLGCEALDAMCR